MKSPEELRNLKNINIQNNDQKCFLLCYFRHITPVEIHPERISKEDKELTKELNYDDDVDFPVQEKDFSEIETKYYICINVFRYENRLIFPIYVSDQKSENAMDLLLVIEDFDRFMFHKTKNKNKKHFCKSCLQCFSIKNVLTEHKQDCLSINGVQSVRLEKGILKFENYFKQIPAPFKIYADFEFNLEGVEIYEDSYSKKYQDHDPCSFADKVVCIEDKFSKPTDVFRGENATYEFIKAILGGYEYCKKTLKTL